MQQLRAYTSEYLHHELQFLLCGELTSDLSLLWLPIQHPAPLRVRDTATPAAACSAGTETRTRGSLAITRPGKADQVFIPLMFDKMSKYIYV